MVKSGQLSWMPCKGLACFFNTFAVMFLVCATALSCETSMEALGFCCPAKSFFRPIFAQHFFVSCVKQVYWNAAHRFGNKTTICIAKLMKRHVL
jgi:hypothetical protein